MGPLAATPEWASEAALDDAFATWVPGQLDELMDALANVPEPEPIGAWHRSDDDLLPKKRGIFRRR
jgi:hypothetical protein